MKNIQRVILIVVISFFLFTLFYSCDTAGSGGNGKQVISTFNSSRSHNTGQDCMSCHVRGGGGDGIFNVAGTVYEESLNSPLPNSIVRLYSTPNGESDPLMVIEVDSRGNFYTTENMDFGDGLYVSVEGPTTENFMEAFITDGSCNSCHENSTEKIWTE